MTTTDDRVERVVRILHGCTDGDCRAKTNRGMVTNGGCKCNTYLTEEAGISREQASLILAAVKKMRGPGIAALDDVLRPGERVTIRRRFNGAFYVSYLSELSVPLAPPHWTHQAFDGTGATIDAAIRAAVASAKEMT